MSKQMIVNAAATEEIRVAIVENGRLLDLDLETQSRAKQKGNIYKGIVANVEDSLEAAFIEFGEEKQGFLALSEIRPQLYPEGLKGKKKPRISEILQRGQEIVVQVTKDEIGSKGAAVTTYLSLPGRYVVLMHSDETSGGISRKIDDEKARRRAREVLSRIEVPDGMAVIIRTAGMNCPKADLYRDLMALARIWGTIDRGAQLGRAPTLLYREPDLVLRTVRDYLAPDVEKIVIDSEEEFEDAKRYFEERMPASVERLELYNEQRPIFEKFGIERAIEELFMREVKLPSGGSVVIDQTEALVAIDVNSGRSTKEQDHEATVYKTNLEAAAEVARQLRLRDLGGIIVIDFIDMNSRRHERDVERKVRDAMRPDKARVKVGRISENGTLEITRQRLRQAHRLISYTKCEHCDGTGVVRDPEGLAISALRQVSGRLARSKKSLAKLSVRLPVDVANVLSNAKRADLLEMQEQHQLELMVIADPRMKGAEVRFEETTRGRAGLEAAQGIKDPRLDADRGGRRGRRGRRRDETPITPLPSQPPPSIGPVPQFLADEETLLAEADFEEEEGLYEDEAEEREAPAYAASASSSSSHEDEHFDDPLTEALLGAPPPLSLVEAEAGAEEGDGEGRRRRRRRRRRKKGGRDRDAEGQLAEGASDDDDEGEGDDEEPGAETPLAAEAPRTAEAGEGGGRRGRRRRRRGGRGAAEAEGASLAASGDDVEGADQEAQEVEEELEAAPFAEAEPLAATDGEAPEEDASAEDGAGDEAQAPLAAAEVVEAGVEEAVEEVVEDEPDEVAEEAPPPRRRRRTKADDAVAAAADEEAGEVAVRAAPEKPARKSRARKKPAEAEAADDADTVEKPARRPRASAARSRAQASAAEPEADDAVAEAGDGAAEADEPTPTAKPRTMRRSRKAEAEAVETPAD